MQPLALIGTVALAHLLAVITPGPDFLLAARNTLAFSRRAGLWTAVGFGCGIAVHVAYSLAGLALLLTRSPPLFHALKLLGAGYLVYIGLRSLFARSARSTALSVDGQARRADLPALAALRMGFLTNVLNPKATLFILSLFTLVVAPDTPKPVLAVIAFLLVADTILWFSLVAVFLSHARIRSGFERFQGVFNKSLGLLLIAAGIQVALSRA